MTPAPFASAHDGLLLVDKPAAWTSHDVVAKIRNHFRIEKVGHGGTLDPSATGLLIIMLGKATKISERVMGHDKTYEGIFRLGSTTTTQDADGEIVSEADSEAVAAVTREQTEAAMRSFIGDFMQTPPMVSAIKVKGTPLYKLARKGQTIEREGKLVHVYRFDLLSFEPPNVGFVAECTKGTYVRTLAHDVGQKLSVGAHLTQLRRTRIGNFALSDAVTLEKLLTLSSPEEALLPLSRALAYL